VESGIKHFREDSFMILIRRFKLSDWQPAKMLTGGILDLPKGREGIPPEIFIILSWPD
jgi:hypothetical protein